MMSIIIPIMAGFQFMGNRSFYFAASILFDLPHWPSFVPTLGPFILVH